jgi:hypothetical protein
MAVTPSGIISGPVDSLADLWAASAQFQSITGAADAAEAKADFVHPGANANKQLRRPFVAIPFPENLVWAPVQRGAFGTGRLMCWYEAPVTSANAKTYADALYAFGNDLGQIVKEIVQESVNQTIASGRLFITRCGYDQPPVRSDSAEGDGKDFWAVPLFFEFGPRGI